MTVQPYRIKYPSAVDIYAGEMPVDFSALRSRENVTICIIKATQGDWWLDPHLADEVNAMKSAGLISGVYHFAEPYDVWAYRRQDVSKQVTDYCNAYKASGCTLRPVLDLEYAPPQKPRKAPRNYEDPPRGAQLAVWCKAWLDGVEAITGTKPIIYSSLNFLSYLQSGLINVQLPDWLKDYDVWIAWYPDNPDGFDVPPLSVMPKKYKRLAMWQYAFDGRTKGHVVNDYNTIADWLMQEVGEAPVVTRQPVNSVSFPQYPGVIFDVYADYSVEIR